MRIGTKHPSLIALLSLGLLAGIARAELSLAPLGQTLDVLAPKSGGPAWVTGALATNDLPAAGKFYRIAIKPGGGGWPAATLSFDAPVDFSKHEVLAIWYKIDAPLGAMQLAINGADGVAVQHDLMAAAVAGAFRLQPGVWYRAYIPYQAQPGWVRYGKQVDFTRIKSLALIGWDDMLSRSRPEYGFTVGGLALLDLAEARADFARTRQRPTPQTAGRLAENRELLAWTADASEKIFRDTRLLRSARRAAAATAAVAGNEYASLLFVVRPARDLREVTAEASALRCGAHQLSATNITVRYVDYVPGLFADAPDPLPLLNGKSLRVNAGENLQIWTTVYVPAGTPPGVYRGAITLRDGAGLQQLLPLQVQVFGFSLSTQTHLKSLYTVSYFYPDGPRSLAERSARYWGQAIALGSPACGTLTDHILRGYGQHRITPELFWFHRSDDDLLALHRQYGFDPIFILYYNLVNAYPRREATAADERAQIIAALQAAGAKRRQAGAAALSVIKIADEPDAAGMKVTAMAAQDAKAAIPDIQSFVVIGSGRLPESLYGLVDTWCPMWNVFDFAGPQAAARRAAGDRFWTYGGEYKTNDGYEPLDVRVLYWLYWKYGITGVHHSHGDNAFSLVYPNATYPHADGLEEIPSIRWEMIRQGVQDYEYLWLLKDLIQQRGQKGDRYRRLLQVPAALAANDKEYTNDPRLLRQRRDAIARAIEKLSNP